jgi:predicted acyltransferase
MEKRKSERIVSLDALRGFDMFFIMGSPIFFKGLAKVMDCEPFIWWYEQMQHCIWDGVKIMDIVFPLFLFIAGISFPLSYKKRQLSPSYNRKEIYIHIIKRMSLLVILGFLYNGFLSELNFAEARYCSVLGRIGIAWGLAAFVFINTTSKQRLLFIITILLGYWFLFLIFKAPDAPLEAARYSPEGNIAGYVDRILLPGKLYKSGLYEAEGILSTLPAICTALIGMFVGEFMQQTKYSNNQKVCYLLGIGTLLVFVGWIWSFTLPLNKTLWSSSFVLYVGGISIILFSIFYWIFDVKHKLKKLSTFFCVIGVNSIFIYLIQKIINFNDVSYFFIKGICNLLPQDWCLVILGITRVSICWLLLYYMYKKKIFFKI